VLGDEWWYPLWEAIAALDAVAMIHVSTSINPALHTTAVYYINGDTAAVFQLLESRVFQDFPTLKIVIPHGGGAVPYQLARYRGINAVQGREPFEEAIKKLYFDTAIYDRDSMEMLIRKMGADNVLFATETFGTAKDVDPQIGKLFDDTVDFVKEVDWLSDDDRHKIFEGNARKLFTRAEF
jgi:4-oxalmesaconate hydratase